MAVGAALMLVLSVAVAVDWNLDLPLAGGVGDRTERPSTPAELRRYELGVGNFQLPAGVAVDVVASSGLGQVVVLGQEEGGLASRIETSAGDGDRRLRLDVRSGLGQVRVER